LRPSSNVVPPSFPEMAKHALEFVNALALPRMDVLGFSLGGMVAKEMALQRSSLVRKMVLVGTAPKGGEDIMHLDKPELKKFLDDPNFAGLKILVKLFFTSSAPSQAAGEAFIARLAQRKQEWEPTSCPSPDHGFPRLGSCRRSAVRQAAQDKSAMPRGERGFRQHDSGQKFLHAERAPTERYVANVSRRRSRFAISIL